MKPTGISENDVEAFRLHRPYELFECLIVCFELTGPDDRVVVAIHNFERPLGVLKPTDADLCRNPITAEPTIVTGQMISGSSVMMLLALEPSR